MEQLDGDTYRLSTGRIVEANLGIVGIDGDLDVFEGYDGKLDTAIVAPLSGRNVLGDPWTPDECAELADFMIARWQAFKEKHRDAV